MKLRNGFRKGRSQKTAVKQRGPAAAARYNRFPSGPRSSARIEHRPPEPGAQVQILSGTLSPRPRSALERLHAEIRTCRRCVEAGCLKEAAPVIGAAAPARIMLIGQAPGPLEAVSGRPISGRSGRVLFEWLRLAGVAPEQRARLLIYMTAITKCFPGKSQSGSGDRRPSRAEVDLCRPFLDRQLALTRPAIILLVGGLAHARFLPGRELSSLVGRVFDLEGRPVSSRSPVRPLLVPLPHPSGASRWLNHPDNRKLLHSALARLRPLLRPYLDAL